MQSRFLLVLASVMVLICSASASDLDCWQYKTVYFYTSGFVSNHGFEDYRLRVELPRLKGMPKSTEVIPIDSLLNSLGKDGWELCGVAAHKGGTYVELDLEVLYLKRRCREQTGSIAQPDSIRQDTSRNQMR